MAHFLRFFASKKRQKGGNSFESDGLDRHFVMKIPFNKAWTVS